MKTIAQTCSTSNYFKAVTRSENTAKYDAWVAASGEIPDQTINFENFTNGETLNNINLGSLGLRILNLENSGTSGILAQNDIGSAPPIGTIGARIDDSSNDGDDIRISFITPVDYVGFYIIDLDGASSSHQIRVNYSDGTLCNFSIDGTAGNCQCEEFLGIVSQVGKHIQNIELYPNGGSQYGIDNLMYGIVVNNTCPKAIEFNMDNCSVGDLAPYGWPAEFVSSNCNLNVSNLFRQVGANSCGSGNNSIGTNMCFNGQNSPVWVDNNSDALRFNIVLGVNQSLQLNTLEIRQGVFQNCPGASTLNNYPRKFGLRISRNGTEIFKSIGTNTSFGAFGWNAFNINLNITGGTLAFEFLSYDPAPLNGSCEIWDIDEIYLYSCCESCTVDGGVIGSDQNICFNISPTSLTNVTSAIGNSTITYQWQKSTTNCSSGWSDISGATNATYVPSSLIQTTFFRRRARNTFNGSTCDDYSNCVTVSVNPQLSLAMPNLDVCAGPNFLVTASASGGTPNYTYTWSSGLGTGNSKSIPAANATYTVTVVDNAGCSAVDPFTVTVSNASVTTGNDGPLTCSKTSVTLTAVGSAGVTYAWSGGGTGATKVVTAAGTYTVTVTNNGGCTASSSTVVTAITTPPTASTSNDGPLTCSKTSVTLTAVGTAGSAGVTYAWSGGGTGATKVVTAAGTYTVTVTAAYGCTASSSTVVVANTTPPTANAGTDFTKTCTANVGGAQIGMTAVAGVTYAWSPATGLSSATVSNPTANPSTTTTYTLTATTTASGCTASDQVVVTVNTTTPIANAGINFTKTCAVNVNGAQIGMTAVAGVTYAWSPATGLSSATVSNPTANPSTTTTYTLTATTTESGCTASDQVVVTVNTTPPTANAGADFTKTCTANASGAQIGMTAVAGVTYAWSPATGLSNATASNPTANPSTTTTYTLIATTTASGCTASDVVVVTLDKTPPPNVSADNIGGPLTCVDNSATIRAFPDVSTYTYQWSGPSAYSATSRTNNVSVSGNYYVTVTNTLNGCTASANTNVAQDVTIPVANAGGNKTICNGSSTTLTASGGVSYVWSAGGQTSASITVSPAISTTYTVTVTGSNGCTSTASAIVTVTPLPASGLTGPAEICTEEYGVFNASPAVADATYAWSFDGGVSLDGDANDATESIKWSTSYQGTTRTITLVVTKDNCSSTYTRTILIKQGAYINTQLNYQVCQGGTVQIGPNPNDPAQVNPGASFQWTPNLFLNSNTVARPLSTPPFDMTYTLTSTVNGCATSVQIAVDVNVALNPIADAGLDKSICISESVQIGGSPTATPPPAGGATIAGILWTIPPSATTTSTQSNPLVSPTTNTQYRVVVVASNGCTDTDMVNVTVLPKQKVGNYTWIDQNANGCQDGGEVGINGITVKLYTSGGVLVGTSTTVNNPTTGVAGYYQFEVCPGSYYANFSKPTGYSFTSGCANTTTDSDANTTTGNTNNFTIISGQDNFTIDAGYIPLGNIRGTVLADTNNDNVGDTPMPNVTIQLKDAVTGAVVATTTTNASGNYEFLNVSPGNYTIMEVQPNGYTSVSDQDATPDPDGADGTTPNDMIPVTVTPGENDNDNNFVEEQPANIRGNVTADTNNDNVGDTPMPNVTIQLKDAVTGAVVATTTTNASGNYEFLNVSPGNYTIMEVQPNGYTSVSDQDATPDPDGADGTTPNNMIPVTVTPGENDNDNNFVEEQPGNIRGTVLADTNNDNVGDTPMPNVTIQLKDAVTGAVVATTTTNASGNYEFLNVSPGNYTIMEVQPNGYTSVSDQDATPDPDGADGTTPNDMIPVTVTPGENDNDNNFVEEQPGNIRGTVLADTNNDNVGDTPMPNVTIQLKDAVTGAVVATTTTNASGNYEFLNVSPGNYTIMEVQPNGYTSVSDQDATPDPDGADGTTPNDMIPVTVTPGENDNDNNFVEEQPGNIRGTVLADTNNDNVGDTPMPNVTIQLKDAVTGAVVATTTTNASGNYEFLNVAPGNYTIMEVQPNGYTSVSDQDATPDPDGADGTTPNNMIPVTVTPGENDNDNNFVEEQPGNIRGNVTADTNNDNVGDTPMPNVTIQLKDAVTGAVVATTTTNASGNYEFLNVAPGNYTIMEVQPNGYTSVSDQDATPDPDGADGTTPNNMIPVTVTPGENDNDNNFVEEQPGNIRGNVTADTNNDNVGDTPMPNVTIQLKDAVTGAVVATTTTNASGNYEFLNVAPGNYTIMEVQPNGYTSVSDQDATPDPDGADGTTPNDMIPVTVTPGENDNDNNFVEENIASLGNYVWEDKNANGSQDAGELGIPNVVVRLFNSAGIQIATTFTDNNGYYQFTNLTPGTYMVKFDKPIGYEPTAKDRVGDGADSDADLVTGLTANINLAGGENNQTIDAGYYKLARIGDFVWEDQNANGVQDALEPGIANVTVTLTGTDGLGRAVNLTTTTTNNGLYEFTNLVPGTYTVTFTKPTALYKPSPSNTPSDDARDSDASTVTGQSSPVTLQSGDNNQTVDAGFYRCASVGDYVFLDVNKNNLQDVTDQGLNGILVELYKSSNPTTPVQTMLTINNPSDPTKKGYYNFEVCELGNYFIKVKPDMTIYNWTQPNQGINDGIDSDIIDFENQSTLIFTVGYAAQITDIDAGVQLRPLPVTLLEFSGRWNETREVNELYWVTASETNNDYFDVERSFKGSNFEVVGKVKGQGNSTTKVSYDLDDADIAKNGVYTYRLKQVDFDGRYTYSAPIEIRVERRGEVSTSIYPNPSVGKVTVEITVGEGSKVLADLFDNTGRLVQANLINRVSEGKEMSTVIDGSILSKGVYYIMVQVDGETSAHKLIILE